MSERQRCQVCGHVGYDVGDGLIERPEAARPTVEVALPGMTVTAPERFVTGLRCVDKEACRIRAEAPPQPELEFDTAQDAEEEPEWPNN